MALAHKVSQCPLTAYHSGGGGSGSLLMTRRFERRRAPLLVDAQVLSPLDIIIMAGLAPEGDKNFE